MVLNNIWMSVMKDPPWIVPTMFMAAFGAAVGIALINSIGNLGGFVGPYAIGWLKGRTGSYAGGLYSVAAAFAASALVTFILLKRKPPRVIAE
jgi:ACS family tartrate transporter-like MFS transporter